MIRVQTIFSSDTDAAAGGAAAVAASAAAFVFTTIFTVVSTMAVAEAATAAAPAAAAAAAPAASVSEKKIVWTLIIYFYTFCKLILHMGVMINKPLNHTSGNA